MKTVKEDRLGFYKMGGWAFLQPSNGDNSESDESPSESEYEESESAESEEHSEDDIESEPESEASAQSEEDAPDWSELEEAAEARKLHPLILCYLFRRHKKEEAYLVCPATIGIKIEMTYILNDLSFPPLTAKESAHNTQ